MDTVYNIQKALEANKRSDVIVETALSITMLILFAGIMIIWVRFKNWKKERANLENKA